MQALKVLDLEDCPVEVFVKQNSQPNAYTMAIQVLSGSGDTTPCKMTGVTRGCVPRCLPRASVSNMMSVLLVKCL